MLSSRWQTLLGPEAGEIRGVLFDAVGTLISASPPVDAVYRASGERHGWHVDEATVASRFRQALRAGDSADGETDEGHERERWRGIVRHVFGDMIDIEPLFQELWAHFARPQSWSLAPDAQQLLSQLAAAGCAVGVASNFDARLRRVLSGPLGLLPGVEVFVSSELGAQKPHVGFFRAIEGRLGLRARELVLVGDDLENDVRGAEQAGWNCIWVTHSTDAGTVPRVRSLTELCD